MKHRVVNTPIRCPVCSKFIRGAAIHQTVLEDKRLTLWFKIRDVLFAHVRIERSQVKGERRIDELVSEK